MKTREIVWPAVVALAILSGKANASVSVIPLLEGEKWWGGAGGGRRRVKAY